VAGAEPMARSLGRLALPAVRAARQERTQAANPALNAPWEPAPLPVPAPAGCLSSASGRTPRSTRSISIPETAAIRRATAPPQPISAGAAGKGPFVTLVVGHWLPLRSARPWTPAFAPRPMAVLTCAASGSSVFLAFKIGALVKHFEPKCWGSRLTSRLESPDTTRVRRRHHASARARISAMATSRSLGLFKVAAPRSVLVWSAV
jgi:hypothetical protein